MNEVSKIVREDHVMINLDVSNKDEALDKMADVLVDTGCISDKKLFLDDVYYRETLGDTAIGNKIAIPHGKSDFVLSNSVVIAKLKNDIVWSGESNEYVDLIVLFAVEEKDKSTKYLKILAQVATILGNDDKVSKIRETNDKKTIINVIRSSL